MGEVCLLHTPVGWVPDAQALPEGRLRWCIRRRGGQRSVLALESATDALPATRCAKHPSELSQPDSSSGSRRVLECSAAYARITHACVLEV